MREQHKRYIYLLGTLSFLAISTFCLAQHDISEEIKDPMVSDFASICMMGFAVFGAVMLMHQIRK